MISIPKTQASIFSTQAPFYQMMWKRKGHVFFSSSLTICLVSSALLTTCLVTTVLASSHHAKLLELSIAREGIPKTLRFPLYEQGDIQYFSAGLGKEERSLTYPPFSLKLIFVQGERAFLAGVSIQIMKTDGTPQLTIPGQDVEGPWLFINLRPGTYVVGGTDSNGTTIKKTVTINTTTSSIVHLRFP